MPTNPPAEDPTLIPVRTANQLAERVKRIAEAASVSNVRVSTRLTTDGTKLYGSVSCESTIDATQLLDTLRRKARAEFGQQGSEMTARRDFRHVHVFLPVPLPDAERGAQFLAALRTETSEF